MSYNIDTFQDAKFLFEEAYEVKRVSYCLSGNMIFYTCCIRAIMKRNSLLDLFLESRRQLNEVSHNIPLLFLFPEFPPSPKIHWNVAVADTAQASFYEL
jgi:hypothetical protein